jgi:F-type H+-transporting ATPase subunit c
VDRLIRMLGIIVGVVLITTPAMAQAGGGGVVISGAIGAGLVVIGASYGIGKLAAAAFESMARQPEVQGRLFISLIIAAALIEGFTFFAVIVCMQQNPWAAAQ